MNPDERFALDSQAAIRAMRGRSICVNIDPTGAVKPIVSLAFNDSAHAKIYAALALRAMRSLDAVETLDAEQTAAGFGEIDEPVLV